MPTFNLLIALAIVGASWFLLEKALRASIHHPRRQATAADHVDATNTTERQRWANRSTTAFRSGAGETNRVGRVEDSYGWYR